MNLKTIDDHGVEDVGMAEIVVKGLGDSSIDDISDTKGIVGSDNNTELTDGEERGIIERCQ